MNKTSFVNTEKQIGEFFGKMILNKYFIEEGVKKETARKEKGGIITKVF